MKKIRFIAVLVLLTLVSTLFVSCQKKEMSSYVSANFYMKEDGTFKILYLTDMHFINSDVTSEDSVVRDYTLRDEWAKTAVRAIVRDADPDLIVMAGDMVFTGGLIHFITQTSDNEAAFMKAARFIDEFGIPWAFVFGNHDEEGDMSDSPKSTKMLLSEYLRSDDLKHCLFFDGPEEINGLGNYVINVLNRDSSVNTSLVFFDSGSHIRMWDEEKQKVVEDSWKYEYVHDDQLDWYEAAIRDISAIEGRLVPSIVFQHIPLPIYQTVLNAYMAALEKQENEYWRDTIKYEWPYGTERTLETEIGPITYHGGVCNKEDQEVCHSFIGTYNGVEFDGGHEFDRILSLGSTKHVFCGHDHRNTFSFTYKGVRLSYGMSIDYSAVGLVPFWHNQNIYEETEQRGGTLITLKADGSTSVAQIPFAEDLYGDTLKERNLTE